nr:hypothetical protein [Pseudomonas benzenivorans]
MRRGELFELRWEHVSLERRTAHLRASKNGFPRTPPLTPQGGRAAALTLQVVMRPGVNQRPRLSR